MISYQKWEYDMFKHHFKRSFPSNWMTRIVFQMKRILFIQTLWSYRPHWKNYCLKNGIHLEYISKYKPITFILDGKAKYTAEAQLIRGRFYSGYTLICTEILEDTET